MDGSKSTADEFAAPLTLSLEEDGCICTIKWRNAPGCWWKDLKPRRSF